jgi:hypothetical protein
MLNFLGRKWNHWIHGNIRENRKLKNINHLLHIRIKMKISPTSLENWNFCQITARCIWHSITNKSMFFSNLCKRRYLTFLYIKIFKSHLIFYAFYLHNQKKNMWEYHCLQDGWLEIILFVLVHTYKRKSKAPCID